MTRCALFLSPHLDDVAFSCGGLLALLADAGWHTIMATIFTRSVHPAEGFALACQLDKNLAPEIDYMALRREEDTNAAAILNAGAVLWLDLPEAPHRGYNAPPELFGAIKDDDTIAPTLAQMLRDLASTHTPDLVLAPQALGNHVDHQITAGCAKAVFAQSKLAFYRDTPYAIRNPQPSRDPQIAIDISSVLDRKINASIAYTTQIGFQFGGASGVASAMRQFALQEGAGEVSAEVFSGTIRKAALFQGKSFSLS